MVYKIINPSDKYTIEAHSLDVAAVACLLLGSGQYAFVPLDGGEEVPLLMFGEHEAWCQQHFQQSLSELIADVAKNKATDLAECLESCLIGDLDDRGLYSEGLALIDDPAKKDAWRERWHDQRRSSLNDIGQRAYQIAQKLREKSNPVVAAPQHIFYSSKG